MDDSILVLAFIGSIVVTWSIGLFIPLMIRYVIVRKPMKKTNALLISVINYFISLFIFIVMGSKSKTHSVLFDGYS